MKGCRTILSDYRLNDSAAAYAQNPEDYMYCASLIPIESRLKIAKILWDFDPIDEQKELFLKGASRLRHISRERRWGLTTLLAYDIATFALAHPLHLQVLYAGSPSRTNILLEQVKRLLVQARDSAVAVRFFPFCKELWMDNFSIGFGGKRGASIVSGSPCHYTGRNIERLILDDAYGFCFNDGDFATIEIMYKSNHILHITAAGTRDFEGEARELAYRESQIKRYTAEDWEPYTEQYTAEDWRPFIDVEFIERAGRIRPTNRLRHGDAGYIRADTPIGINGQVLTTINYTDLADMPSHWYGATSSSILKQERDFAMKFRSRRTRMKSLDEREDEFNKKYGFPHRAEFRGK